MPKLSEAAKWYDEFNEMKGQCVPIYLQVGLTEAHSPEGHLRGSQVDRKANDCNELMAENHSVARHVDQESALYLLQCPLRRRNPLSSCVGPFQAAGLA